MNRRLVIWLLISAQLLIFTGCANDPVSKAKRTEWGKALLKVQNIGMKYLDNVLSNDRQELLSILGDLDSALYDMVFASPPPEEARDGYYLMLKIGMFMNACIQLQLSGKHLAKMQLFDLTSRWVEEARRLQNARLEGVYLPRRFYLGP